VVLAVIIVFVQLLLLLSFFLSFFLFFLFLFFFCFVFFLFWSLDILLNFFYQWCMFKIIAFYQIDSPNRFCFRHFVRRAKMGQIFCCVKVDQSTLAIRESFGKFDEVLEPGCHCMPWICGKQIAGHLTLRVQQLDVRCETMTKVYCALIIFIFFFFFFFQF
jgi:hypothetical protein